MWKNEEGELETLDSRLITWARWIEKMVGRMRDTVQRVGKKNSKKNKLCRKRQMKEMKGIEVEVEQQYPEGTFD